MSKGQVMISLQSEDPEEMTFGEQPPCPQLHLRPADCVILPPWPQPMGLGKQLSHGHDTVCMKPCEGDCVVRSGLLQEICKTTQVSDNI